MHRIGIIADTHGLLRPEAVRALQACDHILHAGDVGKPEILSELAQIAPLTAIRGNIDHWAGELPDTSTVSLFDRRFYLLHDLNTLDIDPAAQKIDVVVAGHSHKPAQQSRNGVIFLNPGSAGPRRFKLPVCLAIATITDEHIEINLLHLL